MQKGTLSCTTCPYRVCVPQAQSGVTNNSTPPPSSGPNIGAIVGGIIGGLVFIAIGTWLVWRFVIKKRRAQFKAEYEAQFSDKSASYAATLRTRASMASTTYTRASNVIQIAFIPGVTGRSDDTPVPPIPSSQPNSPFTDGSGDHYFMPGDLRDSTYSGFTDDGASIDRRSVARSIAPSIAPSLLRQSVASTIYEDGAVQRAMPAQTAQRGRANVVSVQRSAPQSRSPSTPAVPYLDRSKYKGRIPVVPSSPGPSNLSTERHMSALPEIQVTSDAASDFSVATAAPSNLQASIEEAAKKAAEAPTPQVVEAVKPRDPSPFSDENRLSDGSNAATTPR